MKRVWLATAACLALAACQQERETSETASTTTTPRTAPSVAPSAGADRQADAAESGLQAAPPMTERPSIVAPDVEAPAAPELAYAYRYALEAPEARVPGLMRRHERACVLAGTSTCQLLGAETAVDEESGKTGGELTLRATPVWIEEFRDQIDEDVVDVDGRVLSAETGAEDVSEPLADHRAVLVGLRGERDRLAERLRVFRGSLEDRQKLERDLDAAQAELDAASRSLGVQTARVVMATMSVRYQSAEAAPARGDFAPVVEASRNFGGLVAGALGVVITLAGVLVVPAAVIGAGVLGVRWLQRRRQAKPSPAAV